MTTDFVLCTCGTRDGMSVTGRTQVGSGERGWSWGEYRLLTHLQYLGGSCGGIAVC